MLLYAFVFTLMLAPQIRGAGLPITQNAADCLTQTETTRLSTAKKIDDRIKIYNTISERFHKTAMDMVARKSFEGVPALLACWKDQLTGSLRDIEANVNRKKKSGALINYEIQLRKSLVDVKDAQLKVPFEQQSDFDSWLAQAEKVRQKFVDILFQM